MKKILVVVGLALAGGSAMAQSEPAAKPEKESLNGQPENQSQKKRAETTDLKKNTPPGSGANSSTAVLQREAVKHIKALKNGVLLIRLHTADIAIKSLQKAGNETMAADLQRQQDVQNKQLAAAFQEHFTFCPVYFFYSTDSEKVKQGELKGVLMGKDLRPDSSIAVTPENIYVSEITQLEQFRSQAEQAHANNNPEVSFRALVIRNNELHQLAKPFPYFIKASSNIPPRKRSEVEMVTLLNKNLADYYKMVAKKPK
jgi:hypothetical protein